MFLLSAWFIGLSQTALASGFQTATYPGGASPNSVVAGDFNGDRKVDLVVADSCYDLRCTGPSVVSVLLGRGNGTFRKGAKYVAGVSGESAVFVTAGDFNGDGALDLAVINQGVNIFGDLSVLLGNGDGSFQSPVAHTVGGAVPVWAEVGDFNGDHVLDIAVSVTTTDSVAILLGVGDGTFQPVVNYDVEGSPQGLAVADLNRDGKLDLAVSNECGADPACRKGTVSILLGKGDGTFQHQLSFAAGLFPLSVGIANFNGDHHPDLAIASPCGTDDTCVSQGGVGILLGNGDGTFGPIVNYPAAGNDTARLAVGDLDGDSRADVVALNYQTADVRVLAGNGDGTLQAGTDYSMGGNPISVVVGDLNRDGAADFVVVSQTDNNVTVFLNTGAGD
jgi:hypothetical protein